MPPTSASLEAVFSWRLKFAARGRVQSLLDFAPLPSTAGRPGCLREPLVSPTLNPPPAATARHADYDKVTVGMVPSFEKLCRARRLADALLTFIGAVAPSAA